MGALDRELAQRRGQRKVDAMKRRTGQLRRRVVATAIVGFVLLWTVVFVQMATGNDPALGTGASARPITKKKSAPDPQQRSLQTTAPPRAEAERVEAEQLQIERQEAEARELEELEPLTTGQS